jgi:hypothetical protein
MKTKEISLYYEVLKAEIIEPPVESLERKNQWIKGVQESVEADWKPKMIKVTYSEYNPDVEKQRKFFNGAVVEYWIIQTLEHTEISSRIKKEARETLLDNLLGYDIKLLTGQSRRRRSTTDFNTTQKWFDFLETVRETEFEPNGFEFPDSKYFWKLVSSYGYGKAKEIVTKNLQRKLKARLSTGEN